MRGFHDVSLMVSLVLRTTLLPVAWVIVNMFGLVVLFIATEHWEVE